jgi:hypothetical protein
MDNIKQKMLEFGLKNKYFLIGLILHVIFFWGALSAGFCTYKQGLDLSNFVKGSIVAMFPWTILTFICIFTILFIFKKNKKSIFLGIFQYTICLTVCVIVVNYFFCSNKSYIYISFNLAIPYFIVFLLFLWILTKLLILSNISYNSEVLQDWTPPIVYRFLKKNKHKMEAIRPFSIKEFKKNPSHFFIIAFMVLLIICAVFLTFNPEKSAEKLASTAYIFLIIGVVIEVYMTIKRDINLN